MNRSLTDALAAHAETDLTVRVVNGFFDVLPFAPGWRFPGSLEAAAAAMEPAHAARVAARAEELARAPGPQGALAAFDFLDKGDAGIALFSGLRGAVQVARGQGASALEMDPQQAADAGLKAVGLAFAGWRLFDGPVDERARELLATETGRALLTWYVAADVVLPFADNMASGGVDIVTRIIDEQAVANADRLAAVAGSEVQQAVGMLQQMAGTLRGLAGQAATFAAPLSAYAQQTLPGILATADKVTGVAATGADALAAYRCLGATLVAEVCLARAVADVRAQVAEEEAEAERARQAAEAARQEEERKREAAREAGRAAERAAREASKQREDYSLGEAESAASLKYNPIKTTRSAEIEKAAGGAPAKSGCIGCGAGLLLMVIGGAAGMWGMFV